MSDNIASKRIWTYWAQGWEKAPEICKVSRDSWIKLNPTWEVISLDQDTVREFIPDDIYDRILKFGGKWTNMTRCELIRLYLVASCGGVYTDATNICNHPLDDWLVESRLVDNIWLHWDFNSLVATYNFLYSRIASNEIFLKAFYYLIDDTSLHVGSRERMFRAFNKSLDADLKNKLKTEKQIGKSSNRTKPKQGTKIIANSFRAMVNPLDEVFLEALKIYPFFKLAWKFKDNDKPLQSVFPPDSKLIYLLTSLSLLAENE
jgi:hypothetical protein